MAYLFYLNSKTLAAAKAKAKTMEMRKNVKGLHSALSFQSNLKIE
jgi:hypothetical protein